MFKPDWQGFNVLFDKLNDPEYTRATLIVFVPITTFSVGFLVWAVGTIF